MQIEAKNLLAQPEEERQVKRLWNALVIVLTVTLLGYNLVIASNASPTIRFVSEDPVVYGHRPFSWGWVIINPTDTSYDFRAQVWHGGEAWGGGAEDLPYKMSVGSEVYVICDRELDGCLRAWKGTVLPHAEATISFTSSSGEELGRHLFSWLNVSLSKGERVEKDINAFGSLDVILVRGSEEPDVDVSFGDHLRPGNMVPFTIEVVTPTLTQFRLEPIITDCPLQGLPSAMTSQPNRTWQRWQGQVQVTGQIPAEGCTFKVAVKAQGLDDLEVTYFFPGN